MTSDLVANGAPVTRSIWAGAGGATDTVSAAKTAMKTDVRTDGAFRDMETPWWNPRLGQARGESPGELIVLREFPRWYSPIFLKRTSYGESALLNAA